MPKIKAYKSNGFIIPVEDARVGIAYKCPWTNDVFPTKKDYLHHLRQFRENTIRAQIRANNRNRVFQELINQPSFEKIIEWIEMHPQFILDGSAHKWYHRKNYNNTIRDEFWINITYLDLRWSDSIRNSHSCPRGGVTCWSSHEAKDGRPTGYPGWEGRIEFQLSHDISFGSDVMEPLGIHCGTGGGISKNRYGYSVKFFASDWPGLEKDLIFDILKGNKHKPLQYGDPVYFR